ncbi:uncharacterized protein LOC112639947 [Camponotus floridanus]|uniref:uncharacterized protein LOC112639947 n=1 Tax=Camponotus floridanus TaxID=104421 RepID=UPI000DC6B373|nr:uncharacterized protein LOC112639947 [Camponotus floridanus]
MINIETQYFNLHKILLLAVGLWPYKQSHLARLQFIFLSSILTTYLIFQCTMFLSQRCTPDFIIKVLSSVFVFAMCVIKYNMFCVKAMKDLLEQLLHVYNEIKDENEIAIIHKYGYNGKRFTIAITVLAAISTIAFIVASFWSNILNIILPTNTSRAHHLLIKTEYLIDQEKYFYLILLHAIVSFCIGGIAALAIGTILFTYLQHVCGMFKIASYRIERAMSIDMLRNINLRKSILIFRGLIYAVDIHRKAMKLSKHVQYSCEKMMSCLIAFGVISVSLNLFRIASFDEELIFPFLFTSLAIMYMFLANYIGQLITNHNHHIFVTAYNVQWYIAPLYIQKIILFLLQRDSKNFTLSVGGLFVASIECFATLAKTSVSYFTVIYSTR